MTRIILLNGPPRAGKDYTARILAGSFPGSLRIGFADQIKRETHARYGCSDLPFTFFEDQKDEPQGVFGGLTPRQAYIEHAAEARCSRGEAVYGNHLWDVLSHMRPTLAVIPDAGRPEETRFVIDKAGPRQCLLLKVIGGPCAFAGCNRTWLTGPK